MTRGQLVARVGAALGMQTDAGSEELGFLQDWANEGVVEVLLRTHIYIDIGDLTLTANQSEYRLDSTILAIDDGRGSTPAGIGPYTLVTLGDMIDLQSAAPVATGPNKYIAIEGDLMIVAPTPASSESLRFFFVPRPSAMTQDSHDPSNATYGGIPTEFHRAIESYMLWRGALYDDKAVAQKPADFYQDFVRECAEIKKSKRQKRGRTLNPPRVGYPGTWKFPGRRNDTYPSR